MSVSDPVADMLTKIRNAGMAKHEKVDIPTSRLKLEIVKILKTEGYIKNFKKSTVVVSVDGPEGIFASLKCAVSVSASSRARDSFPALQNQVGRRKG